MKQSDIREQTVDPVIASMDLAGMEVKTDDSGEVTEVLLRHVPRYMGPERMSAGTPRSRRLCGADPAV